MPTHLYIIIPFSKEFKRDFLLYSPPLVSFSPLLPIHVTKLYYYPDGKIDFRHSACSYSPQIRIRVSVDRYLYLDRILQN